MFTHGIVEDHHDNRRREDHQRDDRRRAGAQIMSEVIDLVSPPKIFSEIIDLVTPTKPPAQRSALPSPATAAESQMKREVDCCAHKPRKRRKPRKRLVCPPSQPDSDDDNGWLVDEWQDVIVNLQSTTVRKVSLDDITGATLKEESSFDHTTAGASLKEESSHDFASYEDKWVCDVCKVKWFLNYQEACEHEESCGKVGNARNGGGVLPPPPVGAYSAAVKTAMEERSEDDDIHSHSAKTSNSDRQHYDIASASLKEQSNWRDKGAKGHKQLDPEAIWISVIFSLTFPPGVLAAYVEQLLHLLKTLPIESHVKGLDNVTNISTLLALDQNQQEKLLSGFLPSWLKLIFSQDFGWHTFTTELLDNLQSESGLTFDGDEVRAYLKATHQKKKWWCPILHMCIEGCSDPMVVEFAKKVLLNLLSMHDEAYYTVLYIGESIQFSKRMSDKDPVRFLSWFPATHTFMLATMSPVSSKKGTNKAACFGLEAIMAILMRNKLLGMNYKEGRCFNEAHCGCRFWGKEALMESLTYVSFEKVDDEFLPIMVHPNLQHVQSTYGDAGTLLNLSMITKTPFYPHNRVEKVFIKAFKSYDDEEEIDLLFQQAEERGGSEISYKLRKEVDLKNASPGVFVTKNGKFAEQGGVLGKDFFYFNSIRKARDGKMINGNWGTRSNKKTITNQIIKENMNSRGECFIPWSSGGCIAGHEITGSLIKFSGFVHARGTGEMYRLEEY